MGFLMDAFLSPSTPLVKTKKDTNIERTDVRTNISNRTYAPKTSTQYDYNPQVIIDSPDASLTSKKELSTTQRTSTTSNVPFDKRSNQRTGGMGGASTKREDGDFMSTLANNMTGLALLGIGAYIFIEGDRK